MPAPRQRDEAAAQDQRDQRWRPAAARGSASGRARCGARAYTWRALPFPPHRLASLGHLSPTFVGARKCGELGAFPRPRQSGGEVASEARRRGGFSSRRLPHAAHQQADALDGGVGRVEHAGDARPRTSPRCGRESVSSSSRSSLMTTSPQPLARSARNFSWTKRGGADVEAARRLRGDQHGRIEGELARQQRLLQIAAGQRAGPRHRPGAAYVVGADLLLGEGDDGAGPEQAAAAEGRVADARQHHASRRAAAR